MDKNIFPATLNLPLFNAAGDQFDNTWYDRLILDNAAGIGERRFFSNGLNDQDPVSGNAKTLADTNVKRGVVAEGKAFGIFALHFIYESNAVKTEAEMQLRNQWLMNTVIEFDIESKQQYGQWKLSEIFGAPDLSLTTAGATGQAAQSSQGQFNAVKPLNMYIPLPRLTSYNVIMKQYVASDAALDGDFLYCGLVGIENRAG